MSYVRTRGFLAALLRRMALRDAHAVGRGRAFWLTVKQSAAIVDGHGGAAYGLFVDDKLAPISPAHCHNPPRAT